MSPASGADSAVGSAFSVALTGGVLAVSGVTLVGGVGVTECGVSSFGSSDSFGSDVTWDGVGSSGVSDNTIQSDFFGESS